MWEVRSEVRARSQQGQWTSSERRPQMTIRSAEATNSDARSPGGSYNDRAASNGGLTMWAGRAVKAWGKKGGHVIHDVLVQTEYDREIISK